MKPIKIAIIGYGKIAEDQHVPSILANPRFELAATSSRSGQGVKRAFTDWRELIRSVEGLEAVAITTPPGPRYEIARECVLAGLHCLLEKPPAAGLAEIADLACLAEAEQVTLFTTWHAQNNPAVDEAARRLAGKRIKSMAVRWHENVHKWHPGQKWIFEAGGFGVFDPGINAFSIITKIFPGAVFVREAELHVPKNAQTPIAANIELASPAADGASTSVSTSAGATKKSGRSRSSPPTAPICGSKRAARDYSSMASSTRAKVRANIRTSTGTLST